MDGCVTLKAEEKGTIIGLKDQNGKSIPVNGEYYTSKNPFVKMGVEALCFYVDKWFILVDHVFDSIPRGSFIRDVYKKDSH